MSIEMHVFSDRRLNSLAEWQRAIDSAGFALRFSTNVELAGVRGLLPCSLGTKKGGFECFHDDAEEMMQHLGRDQFDHRWLYALGLRFGADTAEISSAWIAAAAYADATAGIVFDHEETRVFSPRQARDVVAKVQQEGPDIEAAVHEALRQIGFKL